MNGFQDLVLLLFFLPCLQWLNSTGWFFKSIRCYNTTYIYISQRKLTLTTSHKLLKARSRSHNSHKGFWITSNNCSYRVIQKYLCACVSRSPFCPLFHFLLPKHFQQPRVSNYPTYGVIPTSEQLPSCGRLYVIDAQRANGIRGERHGNKAITHESLRKAWHTQHSRAGRTRQCKRHATDETAGVVFIFENGERLHTSAPKILSRREFDIDQQFCSSSSHAGLPSETFASLTSERKLCKSALFSNASSYVRSKSRSPKVSDIPRTVDEVVSSDKRLWSRLIQQCVAITADSVSLM